MTTAEINYAVIPSGEALNRLQRGGLACVFCGHTLSLLNGHIPCTVGIFAGDPLKACRATCAHQYHEATGALTFEHEGITYDLRRSYAATHERARQAGISAFHWSGGRSADGVPRLYALGWKTGEESFDDVALPLPLVVTMYGPLRNLEWGQ